MSSLYRFSPIQNQKELFAAVAYIAEQTTTLCQKITGERLPIPYLTIFAHYPDEYDVMRAIVAELGAITEANNGIAVELDQPLPAAGQSLTRLRIRRPDPYRMQVGCNDFDPGDYPTFKQHHLAAHPDNLRLIERPDYEMIEFFDPDFDVLAYVVSTKL